MDAGEVGPGRARHVGGGPGLTGTDGGSPRARGRRRSIFFCVAALGSVAACGPSPDETEAIGRYLMESLTFARQTADTLMMEEIFLPDASYDEYPSRLEYQGIEEIVGYLTSVHEWGDDVYVTLGNLRTGPSSAVGEWFLAAVQSRPMPDLVTSATGRDVTINGITLIEIEGGRIARAADYWDQAAVMLQLGARIELPDGTVLESPEPLN